MSSLIGRNIDSLIRFFIYVLIFWLPYSPAVVETCVIICCILWAYKRRILFIGYFQKAGPLTVKQEFSLFLETFRPSPTILDRPIAFFLAACLISVIFSRDLLSSSHAFFTKTLEWFIVYYLVIEVFKTRRHIFVALCVFLTTGFATCLDAFIQYYITHKDLFNGRLLARGGATAAFKHANSLAAFLTIFLPAVFAFFFVKGKSKNQKFLTAMAFCLGVWILILTFSRSAIFASILGAGLAVYFLKRKIFIWVLMILFLGLTAYVFSPSAGFEWKTDRGDVQNSFEWRLAVWFDSFKMIRERPLTGHGLNTFMDIFRQYRRRADAFYEYEPTYAHNCYIQLLAETGILGFIGFFWILIKFFKEITGSIKNYLIRPPDELFLWQIGFMSGIFAFLVHSFFDSNFYSLLLSVLFWVMAGLCVSSFNILNSTVFCDKK